MGQATLRTDISYSESQGSEGRDQMGFWLSILALCLLPIEQLMFPFGLRLADFPLMLLTIYGLGRAWQTRQRLEFPLLLPMWLILLSSLVATLTGFGQTDSIIAVVQEVYLFAWFVVLINILKTFSLADLDLLTKIWSVIACAEAVTTFLGMLRIGPSMFYTSPIYEPSFREGPVRAVGTYLNANAAAVYISVSFFVLLATSWPAWLRVVLGGGLLGGIYGTGSNGALMSTLGSLVILVVVHAMTKRRREIMLWGAIVTMGVGVVAVVLFMLLLSPALLPGFELEKGQALFLTLGRISTSLAKRLDLIGWAWGLYVRYPWGTGPDSFGSLRASLHNDYLAFLFERGPIGVVGWLWMIGATLLTPWRAANRLVGTFQRWQVLALGAGFLACAVNAFSHEVSHTRQVWMLMVFLFALSYAVLTQEATSSPSSVGTNGERDRHDPS